MLILSVYQNNSLRNYNYILVCPITKHAAVIDPLNAKLCLALVAKHKLKLTHIINTHEHWDHIEGNSAIYSATHAKIVAHAKANIPSVTQPVNAGDVIKVGNSIELKVLDTPGHTFTHICLLENIPQQAALFSGDTLFNAGAGNCHSGDVELLFETFTKQLSELPDSTRIYPGHDYIVNNLRFAETREPNNIQIKKWLVKANNRDLKEPIVTTIGIEKQINPFFRLNEPSIIEQLKKEFDEMSLEPTPFEVFFLLRSLRNKW